MMTRKCLQWVGRYDIWTNCHDLMLVFAGEGGFGHVVLCTNKLDGRRYAMKKIHLKVKTLSQNNKILRFVHF